MKKCPKCNYKNDDPASHCGLCGERLPAFTTSPEQEKGFSFEPRLWQGGKPRSQTERLASAQEEHDRHYLCPPVGEPLRLDVDATVVVGRDEGCTVRIASTNVSRRHAELLWSGKPPRALLRDLGSQNGTYVNDARLEPGTERPLKDGDNLRLGDVTATYRVLWKGVGEDALSDTSGGSTAVMATVAPGASGQDGAGITGDATLLPIDEVLKRLASLRAAGTLHVDAGGAKGVMTLADGRPVQGSFAGLAGPPAIAAMASLKTGRFRFEQSEEPPAAKAKAPPPATAATAAKAGPPGPPPAGAPDRRTTRLDPSKVRPPAAAGPTPAPPHAGPPTPGQAPVKGAPPSGRTPRTPPPPPPARPGGPPPTPPKR